MGESVGKKKKSHLTTLSTWLVLCIKYMIGLRKWLMMSKLYIINVKLSAEDSTLMLLHAAMGVIILHTI